MKESQPIEQPTHAQERVLYDIAWNERKGEQRQDNVAHFTGFLNGTYIRDGVGKPKEKLDKSSI